MFRLMPQNGALKSTNTFLHTAILGRDCFRYLKMALPTATGIGTHTSASVLFCLYRMERFFQSMFSNFRFAISLLRIPISSPSIMTALSRISRSVDALPTKVLISSISLEVSTTTTVSTGVAEQPRAIYSDGFALRPLRYRYLRNRFTRLLHAFLPSGVPWWSARLKSAR